MNSGILTLIVLGSIALCLLIIGLFYLILILKRSSSTMKKIDYLVDDITYKAESLSVTVDSLNKMGILLQKANSTSKKIISVFVRTLANNKDFIYALLDNLKARTLKNTKTIKEVKKEEKDEEIKKKK